jgi:putative tryptophan/tyrosine transport system substrate-binding protein
LRLLAPCRPRTAPGRCAGHRLPGNDVGLGLEPVCGGVCPAPARARLDREPHCRDRVSLGGGTHRALDRDRGRVRPAQGRRHRHGGKRIPRAEASNIGHPIVLAIAEDPVEAGFVASLARPGGNITGLAIQRADSLGKRLELLREVVPGLRHLAILANVGDPNTVREMGEVEAAARTLGYTVAKLEIRRADDIAPAFAALKGADALYVCADPLVNTNRVRINSLALAARLPTMHFVKVYVEAGGLMCYGPNFADLFRRSADYVDKILHGAKPADIPIEQPTRFELVVNLTTAKALGLAIPESFLLRADEVIE